MFKAEVTHPGNKNAYKENRFIGVTKKAQNQIKNV